MRAHQPASESDAEHLDAWRRALRLAAVLRSDAEQRKANPRDPITGRWAKPC